MGDVVLVLFVGSGLAGEDAEVGGEVVTSVGLGDWCCVGLVAWTEVGAICADIGSVWC